MMLLCAVMAAGTMLAAEPQPLAIDVQPETIVVAGLRSGGTTSLLLVARDESGAWPEITRRHEQLTDDDGDGIVRLTATIPSRSSVVVAVDHADGRVATFPPLGQIPILTTPADALMFDGTGRPIRLAAVLSYGWALLVRPNLGAWTLAISEGGAEDADSRADQRATLAFARMRGRDGGKEPDHLLPRDVLVLIDTSTLRLLIVQRQAESQSND